MSEKSVAQERRELELMEMEENTHRSERERTRKIRQQQTADDAANKDTEDVTITGETSGATDTTPDESIIDANLPNLTLGWESTTADGLIGGEGIRRQGTMNRLSIIPHENAEVPVRTGEGEGTRQEPPNPERLGDDSNRAILTVLMQMQADHKKEFEKIHKTQVNLESACVERTKEVQKKILTVLSKAVNEHEAETDRKINMMREAIRDEQGPINTHTREQLAAHDVTVGKLIDRIEGITSVSAKAMKTAEENARKIREYAAQARNTMSQSTLGTTMFGGLNASKAYVAQKSIPTFKGDGVERPMQYLQTLKDHFSAIEPEGAEFRCMMGEAMVGTARDWWHLVAPEVSNISDFAEVFRARYWGREMQDKVKHHLEHGTYFIGGQSLTKAEYATRVIGNVRDLSEHISDKETIRRLAKHFNENIRTAIIVRNISKVSDLIELLESNDLGGTVNASRNNNRPNESGYGPQRGNGRGNGGGQRPWQHQGSPQGQWPSAPHGQGPRQAQGYNPWQGPPGVTPAPNFTVPPPFYPMTPPQTPVPSMPSPQGASADYRGASQGNE